MRLDVFKLDHGDDSVDDGKDHVSTTNAEILRVNLSFSVMLTMRIFSAFCFVIFKRRKGTKFELTNNSKNQNSLQFRPFLSRLIQLIHCCFILEYICEIRPPFTICCFTNTTKKINNNTSSEKSNSKHPPLPTHTHPHN